MNVLDQSEYQFIKEIPNIVLLGLGGSHAYGTNIETSDIDIRGIYMNPEDELIGIQQDSEQIIHQDTDTVIYSFKKMMQLLCKCNPNTVEILGLKSYLYVSEAGQVLLDNKDMFLSKKAIYTFGKYAESQLNRLINKSGRAKDEIVSNEVRSMNKSIMSFRDRYKRYAETDTQISVYQDTGEAVFDMNLKHIPITTLVDMLNDLTAVHKNYSKSIRNNKAIEHNKLNKHMMHLLRLYMMGIDILNGEIVTYRHKEHDLLMDIRNCKYLEEDMKTPTKEFESLLSGYQKKFDEAARQSKLPDKPDYRRVNDVTKQIIRMYL